MIKIGLKLRNFLMISCRPV